MCFDQKTSFGFAACGLGCAIYVWKGIRNPQLATGIFFFFLMEFLQGFQYFWIDQCDNRVNQVLTMLGYLHICLQPFFCHVMNSALTRSEKLKSQYALIQRLCLVGGLLLFIRLLMAPYSHFPVSNQCPSPEWLRGEKLCTYQGIHHLAWSVPLYESTYTSMGVGLHAFLMFAPFFVMKHSWLMYAQGLFLFATGPGLAAYISPNLHEQASIWCFFSIFQIATMVFLIRYMTNARLAQDAQKKKEAALISSSSNGLAKEALLSNGSVGVSSGYTSDGSSTRQQPKRDAKKIK